MNVWRTIGSLLVIIGITSCKEEEKTSTINTWDEDSEAKMSELDKSSVSSMKNEEACFFDSLDGPLGPQLSVTGGSGTIAFSQGSLLAGAPDGDNDGRVYIGTNDSNYITSVNIGFVAEVSITINAGDTHFETAFIGVGEGLDPDEDGDRPSFDEPSGGSACAYFGVRDNHIGTIINDNNTGKQGKNLKPLNKKAGPGTHRFRLTYDGTHLHLSVQINETGQFIDYHSIDVSDNGFDSTNSRIFFGGSNEAAFNNFEVLNVTRFP